MARALSQIMNELNSVYSPREDLYNKQLGGLDPAMQAEEEGLKAQQRDSFGEITQGANRRGLLFSGIPLAEQAKYTASTFLPSIANMKSKYAQQKFNLQDALAGIASEKYTQGYNMWQSEQAQDAARAGSGGGFSPWLGGAGSGNVMGADDSGYGYEKRKDGGFNFVDTNGRPVSAATYAAATGQSFRSVLQMMADQGDKGAQAALGFVGDDYGYDRGKIGGNESLYNALTWGAMPAYSGPAGAASAGVTTNKTINQADFNSRPGYADNLTTGAYKRF